jgi:hypothetical protein
MYLQAYEEYDVLESCYNVYSPTDTWIHSRAGNLLWLAGRIASLEMRYGTYSFSDIKFITTRSKFMS